MNTLRKELDRHLLDLAWSLWTELGVAGLKRNHQNFLISLEELMILTVALMEVDPRLRDESLDWCSQYNHFFSISRLKAIIKDFEPPIRELFSIYSATLNQLSKTLWPIFIDSKPLNILLSRKSCLRPLDSPALMNIRARSIFGTGARADLITFLLIHPGSDFSISDLVEIGYSKKNLAEILDVFSLNNKLFDRFMLRNQQRYRLVLNEPLVKVLGPIPIHALSWKHILKILIPLRECIIHTEKSSESTKVVKIRNLLKLLEPNLQKLNLAPPPFYVDFQTYLHSFKGWLLDFVRKLAKGELPNPSITSTKKRESMDL